MPQEAKIEEILNLVKENHKEVLERFTNTDKETAGIKDLIMDLAGSIVDFANDTQENFDSIKEEFKSIRSIMVTKDYLDDKLGSLKGELVVAIKNEDRKLNLTVHKLESKKVFDSKDKHEIMAIELFPREL